MDLGLTAIAFTEHVDHTVWSMVPGIELDQALISPEGIVTPPDFDVQGYLEAIEHCRERFPELRILAGVELGEPHWHVKATEQLLADGRFDRVLGSQHCLPGASGLVEAAGLYQSCDPHEVVRRYLAEAATLVAECGSYAVLAHIDYPVRFWPAAAGPFNPSAFEEEFRHVLRSLADSSRTLEVNTRVPLHPEIVRWWRDEGGATISFGSDAHEPTAVAHEFGLAAAMVESLGFRAGRDPYDFWTR